MSELQFADKWSAWRLSPIPGIAFEVSQKIIPFSRRVSATHTQCWIGRYFR